MIKVLMVSSEAVPFAKTGGLADVVGSLPMALREKDVDVRVFIPQYKLIPLELKNKITRKTQINMKIGYKNQCCRINECEYKGIKFYFIDNEYYFGRDGIYGYEDEAERFCFFCYAVLNSLPYIDFKPDIIHCHDWQTGLIPVLLESAYKNIDFYRYIKTIFTIHNLQYQGVFSSNTLGDVIGLGHEYFTYDKLEYYGNINYMKGGLVYSNLLTTVSPTYAEEIQSQYYGEGLDGLLRMRQRDLTGILNGIDYNEYNPSTDFYIFNKYNRLSLDIKGENKSELQKELNLPVRDNVPIISIISRLVSQKGLDLIECVLDEILSMDVQLIVLGTGSAKYEELFKNAAQRYPDKVSANIAFSNTMAHKIYAASDMFLMPSLFEPCGLGQIISLRYGTIPIVRETGGLKDTVQPFNEFTGEGNGFSFTDYNAHDMLYTIRRSVEFYHNKEVWNLLVKRAMECDYSCGQSAQEYFTLYEKLK